MPEQIYIGNFAKGLKNNRFPPDIDNDAFVTLFNFYVWRGRVKKKRGTSTLDRLNVQVSMVTPPVNPWEVAGIALVAGAANLVSALGLEADASIAAGSISFVVGANTYTEPSVPNGTLVGAPTGSGTIDYATGDVTISGGGVGPLTGTFSYYPALPVMGLEDLVSNSLSQKYPLTVGFDTKRAYQINQSGGGSRFYNVSYYKTTNKPFVWSNTDDNQFWTANYQSAFWATNNKPGFHFKSLTNTLAGTKSILRVDATTLTVGLTGHGLIVGDHLWFNEVGDTIGTDPVKNQNVNGQTGRVTVVVDADTLTVVFDGTNGTNLANFQVGATGTLGIVQLLTSSIAGQDGIKWYDGDPTAGTGIPTGSGFGWVNFAPPLTATTTSVNDLNPAKYYLVGALAIVNFKDRLLFFGPQIQSVGGVVYQRPIQDTVIFSWNGTPYYSALVPTPPSTTEGFDVTAYYVDEPGKGGYQSAGIAKPAVSIAPNGDVLLVGFGGTGKQTRLVYTGNDIQPFIFYLINSEKPTSATFSAITMDEGKLDIGQYGLCLTTQQSATRVDMEIPDTIFQIQASNNGVQRVNAVRDFFREVIYFTYPTGNGSAAQGSWKYPTTTLFYNYIDATWALFKENFTTQGTFRKSSNLTWLTLPFKTWNEWRQPWNSGTTVSEFPSIVVGNPQGYVLIRTDGTGEAPSGDIQAIADNGLGLTRITSVNHCVNIGDYLYFTEAIGSTYLNGLIGKVTATLGANAFDIDIPFVAGTYLGLGKFTRLIQPLMQTKQFPVYWQEGRKVRLGVQKYLLDATQNAQVTLNINLSQDLTTVFNQGPIVPSLNPTNNSLVASQILYTCPELTNIGLTRPNINLQMPTAEGQAQIWHRINTSLIGDTFQIGITLSDTQMKNLTYATSEIVLHGMQLTVDRGPLLS